MKFRFCTLFLNAVGGLSAFLAGSDFAQAGPIVITEWMYNSSGAGGEYIELTNISQSAVDLTGWSQDDSNRVPGKHGFGATVGLVQPGESVIITESTPAAFRTAWNLAPTVKIVGPYSNDNLGRSDEINIYDSLNALVDRLTFNDQAVNGGPRTSGQGGNLPLAFAGQNAPQAAVLSVVNDIYHSYASTNGDIGNPGAYTPVPEPATIGLMAGAALGFAGFRLARRRK